MDRIGKFKFTVEKHGRKWTQITLHYKNGNEGHARILKDSVAELAVGDTVERDAKLDIQSDRYSTVYELILLSDSEMESQKEIARQAAIKKWWGYFLNSYRKGMYYLRAVEELHSLDYHDKDNDIRDMQRDLETKRWWGYFKEQYRKGYFYQRAVDELHGWDYHDKDSEIEHCRQELEMKKQEMEQKRQAREAMYAKFNFPAPNGFYGKPKKGDMFVKNDIPYEVVSSYYNSSDGFSFGVLCDQWYAVKALDVSDTARGKKFLAAYQAEQKKKELQMLLDMAQKALIDFMKGNPDDKYAGATISINDIPGEDLINTFDIYGGGYLVRVSDDKVWLVINNGSDGAMWDLNNIQTGGAGAYGYIMDYDDVKDRIDGYLDAKKKLEETLS